MPTSRRGSLVVLFVLLVGGVAPGGEEAEKTFQSARWLLDRTTRIRDGQPKSVDLRALRQLRDPALKPLFLELTRRSHPVLQTHGILGLAELSDNGLVDLARVSALDSAKAQAQLLSAAVDGELISAAQARQILTWDVDGRVKLVAAMRLVATGSAEELPVLKELTKSDRPAVRGLAALLRLQLGDSTAMKVLEAIGRSGQVQRVRRMLLEQAIDHSLKKTAGWALQLARSAETSSSVAFLALRLALKADRPGAADAWAGRYRKSPSVADRIRLASLAPAAAEQLAPEDIQRLREADSGLIRRFGEVAGALAAGQPAIGPIMRLLKKNHPLASKWVLQRAREIPFRRARPLLVGLVYAAEWEPNPERFRSQRLERVVFATEALVERGNNPGPLVRALIRDMPTLTAEAVVMGLVRSRAEAPYKLIEGIDEWPSKTARSMAVLLRAKHGVSLEPSEMERLSLIVRGGAGLKSPLRVQAAWTYLKRTEQTKVALAGVVKD